ncbi:MAG: hypothetical protein IK045_07000 [Bacteroidales bacterium]|nr:hypothetical protein [Bacteroidales bacterium]
MKKLALFLFAVAALTAVSCSKEIPAEEPQAPENPEVTIPDDPTDWSAYDADKFLVSFTGSLEQTKADVDFSTGIPSWAADDLVLVYVAESGASGKYKFHSDDSKFYPVDAEDIVAPSAGQTVYVYYPWSESLVPDGATAAMTLPSEFNGSSPAPMAGTVTVGDALSGLTVPFKNLGALLHVTLTGSDMVTAVEFSNSNVALAGAASISWEGGVPVLSTSGSTCSVKASIANPSAGDVELCFLLPPSSSAMSDMSLKVIFGKTVGEVSYEPYEIHSRTSALSYARNDLRHLTLPVGFFSGGDGSEEHPYQISTREDFMAIAGAVSDNTVGGSLGFVAENGTFFGSAGAHYVQTADIDFEEAELTPIGNDAAVFSGVYDGDSKLLSNYKISASTTDADKVGAFGLVKSGEVKNVHVKGAAVTSWQRSGILVGWMEAESKVTDCLVEDSSIRANKGAIGGVIGYIISGGTVSGCSIKNVSVAPYSDPEGNNFGGVIGYLAKSSGAINISDCHTDAASTIQNRLTYGQIGGIVGGNAITTYSDCTISDCTNAASLSTDGTGVASGSNPGEKIGGIVGMMTNGHVINCSNTGTLTSARGIAGGIAGVVSGGAVVEACWSNGTVTGVFNCLAAIVGNLTHGAVVLCHGKGNISGAAYVGGIVGLAKCSAKDKRVLVHQCLSQANVTASTGTSSNSGGVIGGLRGFKVDDTTAEYAMVTHCVGWKASVKNTNETACNRFGAFVGYVASELSGASSTNNRTFIENCYTALEDADLTWASGVTPTKTGGFIGELVRGRLGNCFYRISDNTQAATTKSNEKWISPALAPITENFASTLLSEGHLGVRTTQIDVKNNSGIKFVGSEWTMTGKNGETLSLPLPSDLVALGPEFYQ